MVKVKEYIKNVYNLMRKREMLTLPSSLSYYFVLSIVPVISIILLIATNFNISTNYITNFFQKNFSSELVNFLTPLITKVKPDSASIARACSASIAAASSLSAKAAAFKHDKI